jgi:hypothetical protein
MSIPRCCFPLHIPATGPRGDSRIATSAVKAILQPRSRFRARVRRFAWNTWGRSFSANGNLTRSARRNATVFRRRALRHARDSRPQPTASLAKSSRANFHSVTWMPLRDLPWRACAGVRTTIGRRFRHRKHKILWFVYEFFLTSFPQPPILRFQARGSICWPQRFGCPQPVVEPDRV